jgi:hypothetical protein
MLQHSPLHIKNFRMSDVELQYWRMASPLPSLARAELLTHNMVTSRVGHSYLAVAGEAPMPPHTACCIAWGNASEMRPPYRMHPRGSTVAEAHRHRICLVRVTLRCANRSHA